MTAAILPPAVVKQLTDFAPAFKPATFLRFVVLILAAILTTGSRTICNLVRTIGPLVPGHVSSYHKVFTKRRWSTWTFARCLTALILKRFVPKGIVHLACDDTVDEHPGKKVYGKGRHRDPIRSSHSYTAFRYGHKWVVVSIVVRFPFSRRHWALPVLIALYRTPQWDKEHHMAHKTPPEILEGLLSTLLRWFPERRFRVAADGNFATHRLACFAHHHQKRMTLVTRCYPDIALYAPPPAEQKNGRPRVKGAKLPLPQDVVKNAKRRMRLTASWYGGKTRQIEVVTGTGHWYRQGHGIVEIRWVFVHDLTGTHRDEYFFTTDTAMTPKDIVETYTERWSIEVTFEESRAYLGFGTTRCRAKKSVLREGPFLLSLYSIVLLLYTSLPPGKQAQVFIVWRGKDIVTFSDVMTGLRRWLWRSWVFSIPGHREGFEKFPAPFRETLLGALAPAA
jgi:hypothetical protein